MTATANERPQQQWHWCAACRDYFYGSAAAIHRNEHRDQLAEAVSEE